MSVLEQVPDSLKVTAATTPTVLQVWGFPVEQWMIVASIVVSLMFIIEKAPVCIRNIKTLINWIKNVRQKKSEEPTRGKQEACKDCSES